MLLLIVILLFSSCTKTETGEINGIKYKITPVDSTMNYVIETADFTGVMFGKDSTKLTAEDSYVNLTAEEIVKAEKVFRRCLYKDRMDADSMAIDPRMIQEPTEYYRQYEGFVDEKGQKNIGIQFFTKSFAQGHGSDWKTRRIAVEDGGNSFFSIVINIETEECYFFMVNGEA